MWIVKPTDPADTEPLASKLNHMLLDRVDRPGAVVAYIKVHEVITEPMGDSTAARGVLRFVDYVYADRVSIYYPDPEKQKALEAAPTRGTG